MCPSVVKCNKNWIDVFLLQNLKNSDSHASWAKLCLFHALVSSMFWLWVLCWLVGWLVCCSMLVREKGRKWLLGDRDVCDVKSTMRRQNLNGIFFANTNLYSEPEFKVHTYYIPNSHKCIICLCINICWFSYNWILIASDPFDYCDVRLLLADGNSIECALVYRVVENPLWAQAGGGGSAILTKRFALHIWRTTWRREGAGEGTQQRKLVCFNEISSQPPRTKNWEAT